MTTITHKRKPIATRLRAGVANRLTRIAEVAQRPRRTRIHRPLVMGLDEHMLRDIGMSRSEFMAADVDG